MPLTAVVVDDSFVMRTRLKQELAKLGIQVVGEGASGDKIIGLYEQHRPSLLMLDIVLPVLDGVSAATEVLKKYPEAKVVMCSSLTARDKIIACREAGVRYFILKPFTSEKLAEVTQLVLGTPERPALAVAG